MADRWLAVLVSLSLGLSACSLRTPPQTPTPSAAPPSYLLGELVDRPTEMPGTVTLQIANLTPDCTEFGEPLQIRFIFRNLRERALVFYKGFQLSVNPLPITGYVTAQIQDRHGTPIGYGPSDPGRTHVVASPDGFTTIPPKEGYEAILEYRFPEKDGYSTALPTDPYQVSFIYKNLYPGPNDPSDIHKFFDQGAWTGTLASNSIEVCLTH